MRKYLFSILFLIPVIASAQQPLKAARQRSWQVFVFKISSADAIRFQQTDSVPVARFINEIPFRVDNADSTTEESLPVGSYVFIRTIENKIVADVYNVSDLFIIPVNNLRGVQLDVRTRDGRFVPDASVFVNNREAFYNPSSKTYHTKNRFKKDVDLVVCTPGDTLISSLEKAEEMEISTAQQRRVNYRNTRVYKLMSWMPRQLKKLFNPPKPSQSIHAKGYIIFNQPKYKPLDTVKFKGYFIDRKGKQLKEAIQVFLQYSNKGKRQEDKLFALSPASPGAYFSSFVLGDSIPTDITGTLIFKNKSGKTILRENFKLEDYVLDEIGSMSFRVEKESFYPNDSIRFFASAKDANGLNVMDVNAKLILTVSIIKSFYKDTVYVPDTLYVNEQKLKADGETIFSLPAKFPPADLLIAAKLIFKNSNNELQERTTEFEYKHFTRQIIAAASGDSIRAEYIVNGLSVNADGYMTVLDDKPIPVKFPLKIKTDPLATEYSFSLAEDDEIEETLEIENPYQVSFMQTGNKDTVGFQLMNPNRVPVYFSVFNGPKLIAYGKDSSSILRWQKSMTDVRQMYKVRWQVYWAGKEIRRERNIAVLYKLLKIDISQEAKIFPGQKDSLKVLVTDYMGRPAADVNLTAVSYNNQFAKSINIKEPPYLGNYKSRKYIERDVVDPAEPDPVVLSDRYPLGNYPAWITKLGLDTMVYYKLLFPAHPYYDATTLITDILPELSVNIMDKGIPQEIYLLYVNRELVYYNGVTDFSVNAFPVYPTNVQLGIRLKNKFITIDSLYLQPYYKHDLSFDLNHLPKNAIVREEKNYWTTAEKKLIERSIWQFASGKNFPGYAWQRSTVVKFGPQVFHLSGPFVPNETMTFFSPGDFDLDFKFEPGYQYQLESKLARLERKTIFDPEETVSKLPDVFSRMRLGDTLSFHPDISYAEAKPGLQISQNSYSYMYGSELANTGSLQVSFRTKPVRFMVLKNLDSTAMPLILDANYTRNFKNIIPGRYVIALITDSSKLAMSGPFVVLADVTTCIRMDSVPFDNRHPFLEELICMQQLKNQPKRKVVATNITPVPTPVTINISDPINGGNLIGRVVDISGRQPVPFCSIIFVGTKQGMQTDALGNFSFGKIRPGKYILSISQIGYMEKEITITILRNQTVQIEIMLQPGSNRMEEVVITSAFSRKVTARSVTTNSQIQSMNLLAGKVSGVQFNNQTFDKFGGLDFIRLRGENSLTGDPGILYVVDGVIQRTAPNLPAEIIQEVTVLNAQQASALFGPDGANGAIIITTMTKSLRKDFRDYAFWIPNFFTDKNGVANVQVEYPDNITGWKTYVIGMDAKRRAGISASFTQAYKPIIAALSLPLFLVEGDSTFAVTKTTNYTADRYAVKTIFSLAGKTQSERDKDLQPNAADTKEELIIAVKDSIKAGFSLATTTGFKDGEERKIPVFKKGTMESVGQFTVMQKDSTFSFNMQPGIASFNLYAQNNTLDLLLEEIDHIKEYPFYCMEQMASKFTALCLERNIRNATGKPFKNGKQLDALLLKIQKAQKFDGGWSWWENGQPNFYISNYITRALLEQRGNPLLETTIRNAFLNLENQLPYLNKNELLEALSTLSTGGHQADYAQWLQRIFVDSLSMHQQWQWVKIRQQQKLGYASELKKLVADQIPTMLGGLHWGVENYRWYSNEIATTVLAFEVLSREPEYAALLPKITQYFLEKRRGGYWRNTVESARILNAILPSILASQKDFLAPAKLQVTGDSSFVIDQFPFRLKINNPAIKQLQVQKQGGGMVYLTMYQQFFNADPTPETSNFIVETNFIKNGSKVSTIHSGEKITMQIRIEALKDAEYVSLEMPIPAGCIFTTKENGNWRVFKEYRKDKLLLFVENLAKGNHSFEVELEARYNGNYTLNPAKAELMYYPIFYGRNAIRKVVVKSN